MHQSEDYYLRQYRAQIYIGLKSQLKHINKETNLWLALILSWIFFILVFIYQYIGAIS